MVKRAPSGPGWSASSPPAGCPLPLRPRPPTAAAAAPSAPGSSAREGVSREGAASSGARPAAPGGSRSPGVSGARPSAGRARISCRGSRAPGAAPSDRTTRARGRGRRRRAGPLKSAARRPDPPPPRRRAGCAPTAGRGLPGCASGRRTDDPGAPGAARAWSGTTWRSLFRVRERCALPPSLFMFLGGYWDLMVPHRS